MSIAGDLTTANYWEEVWAAKPPKAGRLAQVRRFTQWKFDRIVKKLLDTAPRPDGEVLELGCAPGDMLRRIHRLRPRLKISGIDYAEEGCRTTAAVLKGLGLPANVYHGDVRTAELQTKFDVVTSFGLIEHFDDPSDILRCHARFCRPGGTVAVALPNFTSPLVRLLADRFCPDNLAIHNLKIMNLNALQQAMEQAGLKNVRTGGDGGTQLHVLISRPDVVSRIYAAAGRVWNAGAVFVPPQVGWHTNLWAIGTVEG